MIVNRVAALGRFLWAFVVGDDPHVAVWVTLALLATLVLSNRGIPSWWLLPLVVAGVLLVSVMRVAVDRRRRTP